MGNRAVITTREKEIGVYLHWNGDREFVEGILMFCKLKGYRPPEKDNYGWARLAQTIGNFFGGELSVGIDLYDNLDVDNGDNGVYVIENWKIVDRLFKPVHLLDEKPSFEKIKDIVGDINCNFLYYDQLILDNIDFEQEFNKKEK